MSDQAKHDATIAKWEREEARKRDKADRAADTFTRTFAAELKNSSDSARRELVKEAKNSVEDTKRGNVDPMLKAEPSSDGLGLFRSDRDEIITGEEPRPWEQDY
jgi:molecular chaperone DnaK (HSP70)